MMYRGPWLLLSACVTCAACASVPVPAERLASAEAGIRGASEIGAEGVPQAALHLKMAHDEVASAKALQRDGDNERAAMVLARAAADAELANSLTRESRARAEANAVIAQVEAMQQQPKP